MSTKKSMISSLYLRIRNFLAKEWPTIRVLIGISSVLTLAVGVWSVSLTQKQLAAELSKPTLSGQVSGRIRSRDGLDSESAELLDEFFTSVFLLAKENPNKSYSELLNDALPISRSIAPAPLGFSIVLKNEGTDTATNVSVSVSWVGEIVDIDVEALTSWEVIDGGMGQEMVLISLDRISEQETVSVFVVYSPIETGMDELELALSERNSFGLLTFSDILGYDPNNLAAVPTFSIIFGEASVSPDLVVVRVSSDQTPPQMIIYEDFQSVWASYLTGSSFFEAE